MVVACYAQWHRVAKRTLQVFSAHRPLASWQQSVMMPVAPCTAERTPELEPLGDDRLAAVSRYPNRRSGRVQW
jgi:hypothetical protein